MSEIQKMIQMDFIYGISQDVVARKIEGETVIIPLTAEIGEVDEELYSLNESGEAIWQELDGLKTVGDICYKLADKYKAPLASVQQDVLGFISELAARKIIISQTGSVSPG
jgi:hypothetical protein